ncbi:hypothetical protein A2863_04710 [Candidatus Woesebacteria bacterium RIFCSPHIGHO2_01_FULL_38_9b]|uniref:Aminotransferase class III n=1 Tax=Candidatus Woesebacteria bacterium RIFCSPHIGHO2_01_FULL_38_9b TaxID=1802493 RepID=A0A1F7Y3L0_9BACT|nr:MAG: hypothetical protein A2863_04710 [Candidatus Woesebacteria bacterium RIFCSPHIGHO2_01_FULL_38_9b]
MLKNRIIYNEYSAWTFNISKAKDSYIWTDKGKKLIDFTSGWNVTNLGWNNPEVTEALIKQAKKNHYAPMWTADYVQEEYAMALTNELPKELKAVGRATGGTEANEEALKTARAFIGKKKIIGFKNTYHGQSFGTMSIGYLPEYVTAISPLVGDFIQIDFPETYRNDSGDKEILNTFSKKLEQLLVNKDVAAVICEAGIVSGWGDMKVAPVGFVKEVRRLTNKYGALMILDEVGTGFSRCGMLFGMQIEEVVPDIATFAKGMSNGAFAIGAMVTTKEIADKTFNKSNVTSTFGWIPIGCAASLKTLQIHKRDKIWQKVAKDGLYLEELIQKELRNNPSVGDVRGLGMEIGIEIVLDRKTKSKNPALLKKIINVARENGLHLVGDNESVIQLMPPLTIDRASLDKGLEILVETINNVI